MPPDHGSDEASTSGYGSAFAAPEPGKLAELFPQLEILDLLGQGGMGAVYKARQKKLDRLVALKILPLETGLTHASTERFTREARALAKLSHPNVVGVHDFGEAGGLFYFIMEYVDGTNLRQLLWTRQLQPHDSLKIIPQICDALQYAHDEGVIHRDIKPENILIDKKGRVKIADFGLAKLAKSHPVNYTLTGSRQMMGTPHYMAPEQMERPLEVDHRADLFSLGVLFYELLTSELPLGRFAPPSQKVRIDRRLDDIVLRALTKEPEQRYQRASEMKAAVEGVAQGTSTPVPAFGPGTTPVGSADVEMIRLKVQERVAGLLLTGVIALIGWVLLFSLVQVPEKRVLHDWQQGRRVIVDTAYEHVPLYTSAPLVAVAALAPIAILLGGAWSMKRLRGYDLAYMACIVAIIPWSPAWLVGIFAGIRGLRVLRRPEVQAAFALTANPRSNVTWPQPPPPPTPANAAQAVERAIDAGKAGFGALRSFVRSVRNYCFNTKEAPPPSDSFPPLPK